MSALNDKPYHQRNECAFYRRWEFCKYHIIHGYGSGCLREFTPETCDGSSRITEIALAVLDVDED